MKNLELRSQPLDQELIDFDKEMQNFCEMHDRAKCDALFLKNWTNLEPHESRASQGHQIIRELLSEVMQMQASALSPNLTRDLEAKIESQKYEIQSLQRDVQTTQDSLNSWDEVNLNSIQGVCFDESVASSTSSVSRITDAAISHLQQAGRQRAIPTKSAYNADSSLKIGCSSKDVTSEHLESSSGSTQSFFPNDFFANWKYRSYSDSL